MVVFHATGMGPEACVLRLVAAALRPWPMSSRDRWTVGITLTDAGATAYRLSGEHARDAIDADPDLIATEDLDLIAYATARPSLDVTALPWDRTYLRLMPSPVVSLGADVAWDAVRVDARPADALSCDAVLSATAAEPVSARSERTRTRVVYEAGDRTARELAERVVAIAGDSAAAVGLAPAELESALRAGDELAYIVSVPRAPDQGCDAVATLARRAPWLSPHSLTPLVDTRAYAIVSRTPRP